MRIAGVDGCKGGWVAVLIELDGAIAHTAPTGLIVHLTAPGIGPAAPPVHEVTRVEKLADLFAMPNAPAVIAVDMPIGLPERTGPKGRAPERLVRPDLGGRQSSVFSIPARAAVEAGVAPGVPEDERYRNACVLARATSETSKAVAKQGFHIFPKIMEIDALLREQPQLVDRVYECHPEVSFRMMQGSPLREPKKVKGAPYPPGLDLRRVLLAANGFPPSVTAGERAKALHVGADDLIDACAAAWTSARIARREAISFPSPPERDGFGLPIAIWA